MWFALARGVFRRSAGWSSRLDEWELAVRVIARRPLLGYGPEGYRIAAFSAVDDDYVRRFGEVAAVDRAHSGVLDVAVSSGVPAALLYVAVLVVVVSAAVSVIRAGGASERGLAAAVIAYAVGQQFLFPIAEIDPLFWLLAGVVSARARTRRDATPAGLSPSIAVPGAVGRVATAMLVSLTIVGAVLGVRSVAADRHAADASHAADRNDAVESSMQAEDLAPLDARHALHTAQLSSGLATLNGVDVAIDAVERAEGISPNDPTVRFELARLRSVRASVTGDAGDRERAEQTWSELLRDAPSCARCHLGAALAAGERGDLEQAQLGLERAADLGNAEAIDRLR